MQRTKKLDENKIKTREQNKGRKSKYCCRHQFTWLIIALLSNRYRSAVAPISLRCRPVSAPLSLRYRTGIAPLSLCCFFSCCRYAVAPLSHRCRTAVAPAQRGYKQFNVELLLLYCHSTVTSAVNRKVHAVFPSRGIIRVTVTIGDCQARVSSSSEGCSTLQKTVKVESY